MHNRVIIISNILISVGQNYVRLKINFSVEKREIVINMKREKQRCVI